MGVDYQHMRNGREMWKKCGEPYFDVIEVHIIVSGHALKLEPKSLPSLSKKS